MVRVDAVVALTSLICIDMEMMQKTVYERGNDQAGNTDEHNS